MAVVATTLGAAERGAILDPLEAANAAAATERPGASPARQPVHTVYGGAQLFKRDLAARLGAGALAALADHAPDDAAFGEAFGIADGALAAQVRSRVVAKLQREPVEDFRIDFEDGFGHRPDGEEDAEAVRTAREVAAGMAAGSLPPRLGLRIKTFNEELKDRAARTLDIFFTALIEATGGAIPQPFVVTLPKITHEAQVAALADLLDALERELGLPAGAITVELMVELPQTLLRADGTIRLPALVAAARGRCTGAHFGTYDHTAACDITAAWQTMGHPACSTAKQWMQVALAGTSVMLSDGATNVLPVAPHRAAAGAALSEAERRENRRTVHAAWRLAYDDVRRSLAEGFYQGWDLHPAQLVSRYAACYAFFCEAGAAAAERLRNFIDKAAQATLVGDVFDDAATGQGLLNFFLRARACGALRDDELAATGLTMAEIESRSFLAILEGRRS